MPEQDQVWQPSLSQKGNEEARINFVQAQVEEVARYHMDCQQSLNVQHSLKTQVR
jgi:hypothetical protein